MFASQNRARSVWQSLYLVLNSWKGVQFIKRSSDLLYKGYKSSVNYDGEPSVSNGIVYQLPSSHLFIHWVPAKLSNRVMPYGVNYCRLQLLFVFWYYWPVHSTGYGYSVDASPASFSAGHCAYAASASCFSCRLMSVSIFFGSYAVSLAFLTQNHYIYV